ncbi:MAG TPA: DUF3810 family protein [Vicinamibacterales bacterium]|nr:DUF3810 family protein [Vicinamibacterales bacterium]
MTRTQRHRSAGTFVVLAAALVAAVMPMPARAVERMFSRGLYPALQRGVTRLSDVSPIAILDIAVCVLLVAWSVVIARRARTVGWAGSAGHAALDLARAGAVAYLLFLAVWGLNYRRVPLEDKLDFDRARLTQQRAFELASEAARRVNTLHADAHALSADRARLAGAFASAEHALGARGTTWVGRPKRSILGFYFRAAAIDGMTDPFFLEVILNPDLLEVEKAEVLAHEWAHLAGFADESEANFLAWLTCLRGDPLAQYSGWLSAYRRAASALPRPLRGTLPRLDEGPRQDLRAISARYDRSSRVVRRAANNVYDTYLKANRIEEGIANYDVVLQLMLGTTLGSDWTPR